MDSAKVRCMTSETTDSATLLQTVLQARQTILPKRLLAPGPNAQQLQQIFLGAASAPDHGRLRPWRLIEIPASARAALGQCFAKALFDRDPNALPEQLEQARDKAQRAPSLYLVVVDEECGDPDIDLSERIVSAGCAVQNMLLMATALGFGSALTSGKALKSQSLRTFFQLKAAEHALCFLSMGSVQGRKPPVPRPLPSDFVTALRHDAAKPVTSSVLGFRTPAAGFDLPFEMLGACHERVGRMLQLLQRLQAHLESHGMDAQARDAARDVMRYFDQAAPLHHQDEELHVFPALRASGDASLQQTAQTLHDQHRVMEQMWQELRQSLKRVADGHGTEARQSQAIALDSGTVERFCAIYVQHIALEEETAYPAAQYQLTPEQVVQAGREMAARRGVTLQT